MSMEYSLGCLCVLDGLGGLGVPAGSGNLDALCGLGSLGGLLLPIIS